MPGGPGWFHSEGISANVMGEYMKFWISYRKKKVKFLIFKFLKIIMFLSISCTKAEPHKWQQMITTAFHYIDIPGVNYTDKNKRLNIKTLPFQETSIQLILQLKPYDQTQTTQHGTKTEGCSRAFREGPSLSNFPVRITISSYIKKTDTMIILHLLRYCLYMCTKKYT